ncbi:MAG: hypothetical protein M0037_11480 [Betaproteobacteria bacterium]|nr:hypothetical protein [Betaproteobacteria bacterium]
MAFDIISRANGTFRVCIGLPQLKALTGHAIYPQIYDAEAQVLHARFIAGMVPERRGAAAEASRGKRLKTASRRDASGGRYDQVP